MRVLLFLSLLLSLGQASAGAPPVLSEVESLRIQNAALERVIVQRAMTDWQTKVTTLKADLEKSHPGWLWDPNTGQWTKADPPVKK